MKKQNWNDAFWPFWHIKQKNFMFFICIYFKVIPRVHSKETRKSLQGGSRFSSFQSISTTVEMLFKDPACESNWIKKKLRHGRVFAKTVKKKGELIRISGVVRLIKVKQMSAFHRCIRPRWPRSGTKPVTHSGPVTVGDISFGKWYTPSFFFFFSWFRLWLLSRNKF